MKKLNRKEIRQLAKSIVLSKPGGIRSKALRDEISQQAPGTPPKDIEWEVWKLQATFPNEISKPARGLFVAVSQDETGSTKQGAPVDGKIPEIDFYEPFAKLLRDDLEEVTEVAPLGGAWGKKWGTPDVVGTYKPLASNLIKFDLQIVAAEIKTSPQEPVTAFGQAVAYRLFATKTYIGMPKTLAEEDKARLESLCMLFGVGLVLFELNKDAPDFSIRMRAQRFSPDMFYVNDFAERLKKYNKTVFDKLFA
jgi:hypothetical protein